MNLVVAMTTPATLAQAAAPASVQVQSIWDFCVKGGPVMIPIALCSLVALTVFIERMISLRRVKIAPPGFLAGVQSALRGRAGRREARALCERTDAPLARICLAGLAKLGEPREIIEKHVREAGEREVIRLRRHLRSLSVIGSIAPLLGLLGTIFGMITAFQTVAASGEALGKTELLAKGIYEALITTAAGLIVAIPVVLAYHFVSARIDARVLELDELAVEFLDHATGAGRAEDEAAATPAAAPTGPTLVPAAGS